MNNMNIESIENVELEGNTFLKEAINALKKNKMAVIGLAVIIFLS